MHTILLVEDNEMNRDLISRRLKRRGFELTLAGDGAEGVEKATAEAPDLILMDMGLPVMDGYEATRLLKAGDQTRHIPVIGLSAHAMSGDAQKAKDAGCDDYDTKPVEWPRLLEKIQRQLAKAREQTTQINTPAASPDAASPDAAERPARVLVVDDNAFHRELLAGRLSALGHQGELAHDGPQALELLAQQEFDAVLLDVTLPPIDGRPLLERLRADPRHADVPVLLLSTIDAVSTAVEALGKGAEDFIPQPFHAGVVAARLNAALERCRLRRQSRRLEEDLGTARRGQEHVLEVLLPREMLAELRRDGKILPRRLDGAVVIDGKVPELAAIGDGDPVELISRWQQIVVACEEIAERHGFFKVRTAGASFLAASLFQPPSDAAFAAVSCALELGEKIADLAGDWTWQCGVHQGPVIAGVVGRQRYQLDLWGDGFENAATVRRHGDAGAVNVSDAVWQGCGGRLLGRSIVEISRPTGAALTVYRVDGVD